MYIGLANANAMNLNLSVGIFTWVLMGNGYNEDGLLIRSMEIVKCKS